mgnify:CR=1 FL=1
MKLFNYRLHKVFDSAVSSNDKINNNNTIQCKTDTNDDIDEEQHLFQQSTYKDIASSEIQ